jgi:hypothetical protein
VARAEIGDLVFRVRSLAHVEALRSGRASRNGSGVRACGAERCVSPGRGGVGRQGVVGHAPGGGLASATWRTPGRRSPRIAGGGFVFRGVAPALSFWMALS